MIPNGQKVILVVGPESSGTRVMADALGQHPDVEGPKGHDDVCDDVWTAIYDCRLDQAVDAWPQSVAFVTRRSMPHGRKPPRGALHMDFPDITAFVELMRPYHPSLLILIMSRSPYANLCSWAESRMSARKDVTTALDQYQAGYRALFRTVLMSGAAFAMASLEGLMLDGQKYLDGIVSIVGLPPFHADIPALANPNRKHYDHLYA